MRNPLLAVKLGLKGIKCDSPGCGFVENDTESLSEIIAQYMNMPCPKCGANLLTEADAKSLTKIRRITILINILAFPFMVVIVPFQLLFRKKRYDHYRIEMDGTGDIKIHSK
jgi:hypothetical protein